MRVKNAFQSGKTLDIDYRLTQVRNLYYGILDNADMLKDALNQDFHRNREETEFLELQGIYGEIDLVMNELPKWVKEESAGGDIRVMTARPVIQRQPYGTVLIVSPWNYPYLLSVAPIISAIAAGNTIIFKPTEVAPNSTQALTKVLQSCLDPDLLQVVTGGVPEATLVLQQKFDKILFTGSTAVGRITAQAAAKHLTPVCLELGGKSPVLVSKSANIPLAARRVAWGKFVNAGQTCVAPDYVLVEPQVKDEFIRELKKAIETFYPNLSPDQKDFAHISSDRMYNRLDNIVKTTNGKVEFQLGTPDAKSRFMPPTVVSDVKPTDSLMKDELFGPLLPVLTVNDIKADGVPFVRDNHDTPLALYVFSSDSKEANYILNHTRSGGAIVNDTILHVGVSEAPFGGIGESGMGQYHGKWGFYEFSHVRTVLRQPWIAEKLIGLRYPPYSPKKVKLLGKLAGAHVWYTRNGPVRRSWLRRIFTTKYILLLAVLVSVLFVI
jgi:aldehyde dehydrogenase (NAD+)